MYTANTEKQQQNPFFVILFCFFFFFSYLVPQIAKFLIHSLTSLEMVHMHVFV